MPFQKGHKFFGKGGNHGGGRPKTQEVEIKKAAAVLAREYIEASVKPVMATYFQLAHGRYVNKYHEGKIVGQEFEADAGTTRHFVDKILPDDQPSLNGQTLNIFIAQATARESGSIPELRANGLQIRVGGGNGKNGNGSDGT